MAYWELFFSAFVSATVFPGGSEAVLAYLASTDAYRNDLLVFSATLGNTLGAITTLGLGIFAARKYPAPSLLTKEKQRALNMVRARGQWILLFSWLPVVGDAFCFAAGWLKMPLISSVSIILLGKLCRYLAIIGMFS